MRNKNGFMIAIAVFVFSSVAFAQHTSDLNIYFIDVEGGQSTQFVSPSGQSLLIDTGFPGERDATRIAATAKDAGISRSTIS
jgi:glyoxylase-like metal-dependent hydrolase (beta-lactamase superfamily II)